MPDSDNFHLPDRYEQPELIAHGGMGMVIKALDKELGRPVAIKKILSGQLTDVQMLRFKREMQILSSLKHQSIVPILSAGADETRQPYFVMEYVDAAPLSEVAGFLTWEQKLNIACEVVGAIDYLHSSNILHRDIKPGNVLITNDTKHAKLVDFGIASWLEVADEQRLTKTGVLVGTVATMSPEQFVGERATTKSDIYSLGCLLVFLFTGKPLFEADNASDMMSKHLHELPRVDLPVTVSASDKQLEPIILRCLAKNAGDRYATTSELLQDLTQIKEGKRIEVVKVRPKTRASKMHLLSLVTGIAVLGIATVFQVSMRKQTPVDGAVLDPVAQQGLESLIKHGYEALQKHQYVEAKRTLERAVVEAENTHGKDTYYAGLPLLFLVQNDIQQNCCSAQTVANAERVLTIARSDGAKPLNLMSVTKLEQLLPDISFAAAMANYFVDPRAPQTRKSFAIAKDLADRKVPIINYFSRADFYYYLAVWNRTYCQNQEEFEHAMREELDALSHIDYSDENRYALLDRAISSCRFIAKPLPTEVRHKFMQKLDVLTGTCKKKFERPTVASYLARLHYFDDATLGRRKMQELVDCQKKRKALTAGEAYFIHEWLSVGDVTMKSAERLSLAQRAYDVCKQAADSGDGSKAVSAKVLADEWSAVGKFSTAKPYFEESLQMQWRQVLSARKVGGGAYLRECETMTNLATVYKTHAQSAHDSGALASADNAMRATVKGADMPENFRRFLLNGYGIDVAHERAFLEQKR